MKMIKINWTDHLKGNDDIRYDHVVGVTPIGDYLITWKSWKERPSHSIDNTPFNDSAYLIGGCDLEETKKRAQAHFEDMIASCIDC